VGRALTSWLASRYPPTTSACELPCAGSGVPWVPASNRKAPATADKIVAMAPVVGGPLSEIRDRALLLIGFAGALRRSELVALRARETCRSPR
jgi:site-specific recombinase XerC